jgi:uncharacterized protein
LFRWTLKRFWPTLATLFVGAVISTQALIVFPERTLFMAAGTAIIVLPLVTYFYPALRIGPSLERWLGPCVGAIGGFLGGVSAFYGPPLMIFLAALRLPKAEFVPAISLMFFVGALGLAVGLLLKGLA